jgi:predicted nucleic acid-binding protein
LAINYLLDAGPLIGLFDASDQWHKWSTGTLGSIQERIATTETALAEACYQLRRTRSALQDIMLMVAEGRVVLVPVLNDQPQRVGELLEKYPLMDAGDATLVVLSEQFPKAKLVTLDRRDFSIYRRRYGRAVPTIMP